MKQSMEKLKQALWSKRALYMLCFVAINFIELLRASQTGNIWYVAVNCTGFVVLVMIISAYPLKDFLTRFNGIYTLLILAAMIATYFHWQRHIGEYYLWQVETAILNIWWIGIMVKYLLQRILVWKTTTFRPSTVGLLWIALSVLMICSVSKRWWPFWFLLMFGCFYLTKFSEKDRKDLWNGMIDGTILSFFGIQIYAYGFRPYDDVRYPGAFSNCNMMALYYLIVYLCVLFKFHLMEKKKTHWGWKLFYLIGAGGLLSFQMFTICRTAWLASIILTFLYGIVIVRRNWKRKWHEVILTGMALVLAMIVTILPVYYTIRWLPTILHYRIWYEGEYSVDRVHSFDPPNSDKYVSLEEFFGAALGRILKTMKIADFSFDTSNALEHHPESLEKTYGANGLERVEQIDVPWLDSTMQKRFTIYKVYWRDTTWYGNGPDKGYYLIGKSQFMSRHAHNLWLQVFFTYGIPAGILFLILTVALLVRHIRMYRKNKTNPYACIPLFICLLFFQFGITEIVWNPGQLILFLMLFVQHPQFYQSGEKEKEELVEKT